MRKDSQRPDQLTERESGFAFRELRHGRRHGYHLMTCEHPLACYAPARPEDTATWIRDDDGRFRPVTTDECDGIIEHNINWLMHDRGIGLQDLARGLNRSSRATAAKMVKAPSTMRREDVGKLCELLGTDIDQLIWRKSTDPDPDKPLSLEKLTTLYKGLNEKHQKMISDMVWELFDNECSHAEVIALTEMDAGIISEMCLQDGTANRKASGKDEN